MEQGPHPHPNPNTFLVIGCDKSLAWDPIDFGQMFEQKFGEKKDRWIHVNVAKGGVLPPDDVIESLSGIVITGSAYNCRDRDTLPWFEPVCELVRSAATKGYPRVYGGCFGCQISAFALGSRVDKNPSGRFILKAETIIPLPSFCDFICDCKCECYSSTSNDNGGKTEEATADATTTAAAAAAAEIHSSDFLASPYQIIVSHGDCVHNLPDGACRLAYSTSCENELFVCGKNRNILCNQSHPEFELEYCIRQRIWPAVVEKNQRLNEDEIRESLLSFEQFKDSSANDLCKFISHFLRMKNSS